MTPKEAAIAAIEFVEDLFSLDEIKHLGLEEVMRDPDDEGYWLITVGFSRPWDFAKSSNRIRQIERNIAGLPPDPLPAPHRELKTVRVRDEDGRVEGVENWVE